MDISADAVYRPFKETIDTLGRQVSTLDNTIREQVGVNPEHIRAFTKAQNALREIHDLIYGRWAEAESAEREARQG